MSKIRVISRMDIKGPNLIKSIQFEGLKIIGDPNEYALKYYKEGIDEIFILDTVATLYGRNNLSDIIRNAAKNIFVPITAGGGVRSIDDVQNLLNSGADKIAINTQAIKSPNFINEASRIYGSQAIIGSIEAKKKDTFWEAYIDNGREETGVDALNWAKELESRGAGELLITSIDKDGTKTGFDEELIQIISNSVSIPVISSGGAGNLKNIISLCNKTETSGIAIASILHYQDYTIKQIKENMIKNNINVRK